MLLWHLLQRRARLARVEGVGDDVGVDRLDRGGRKHKEIGVKARIDVQVACRALVGAKDVGRLARGGCLKRAAKVDAFLICDCTDQQNGRSDEQDAIHLCARKEETMNCVTLPTLITIGNDSHLVGGKHTRGEKSDKSDLGLFLALVCANVIFVSFSTQK